MKKETRNQIWVALKIWIIAVFINATCGTAIIANFFMSYEDLNIFRTGLLLGSLISFPIFILLLIIIKISCSRTYGKMIFLNVLVTGVLLTVLASILFFYQTNFDQLSVDLCLCSCFSAIVSISIRYKPLLKLEKISQL